MDHFFKPHDAGIESSPEGAALRLAELLNALDGVNSNIGSGALLGMVSAFRCQMLNRLRNDGWVITYRDGRGWIVIPEKE